MKLEGQRVIHKKWGQGVSDEPDRTNNRINIRFSDGNEVTFKYPLIFEKGYANFEDPYAQSQVENDIKSIKEIELAKAKEKEQRFEEEKKKAEASTTTVPKKKSTNFESGFGDDYHVEHLKRQPIFPYKKVEDIFKIRIAGFGRGINPTAKGIVLISSVERKRNGFVYHDHWDVNGDYIYSGEGKIGDQKLTVRNKALVDSIIDNTDIRLLVKFSSEEYIYQGVFKCVEYMIVDEKDEEGNIRKEFKYRLRKVSDVL